MENQKPLNQQSPDLPTDNTPDSTLPRQPSEGDQAKNIEPSPAFYSQASGAPSSIDGLPIQPPTPSETPDSPTAGAVIRGGFMPSPKAAPEYMTPSHVSPSTYSADTSLTNSYQGGPASTKYLRLLPLAVIILLLVVGTSVALATWRKSTHSRATNVAPSKSLSSSHTTQTPSTSTSTSASVAPSTPPTSPPSTPSSTPQPTPAARTITLGLQDNGRTIYIPVGTIVNIQLPATSGYRWVGDAAGDNPKVFYPNSNKNGGAADGSINDSFRTISAGQEIKSYTQLVNCADFPACGQPPGATWTVTVNVQ